MDSVSEHSYPTTPVILCGNKSDLKNQRAISEKEGKTLSEKYNIEYFDISTKKNENLDEMMENIIIKSLKIRNDSGRLPENSFDLSSKRNSVVL